MSDQPTPQTNRVAWGRIDLPDAGEFAAAIARTIVEKAKQRDLAAGSPSGFCIFSRIQFVYTDKRMTLYFSPAAGRNCFDLMLPYGPVYCIAPRDTPDLNLLYGSGDRTACRRLLER